MGKKVFVFVALIIFSLFSTSYANDSINRDKNISRSSSDSKDINPLMSGQFDRYTASASNKSPDKTVKSRNKPIASKRRAEVQNKIKELIDFSRMASSDIRSEIKKIKKEKGKRIKASDLKKALALADKFDKYALRLQQKKKSLTDNSQNIDRTLQAMSDLSQELQLQIQDAMNEQARMMQVMSNIMKKYHDTLKSMIRNLK